MAKVCGVSSPAKVIGVSPVSKVIGVEVEVIVPEGLIVILASGSVPSGWTRYSAADGKFIVGSSNTKAVGSTGGSSTVSTSATSSSAGSHAASVHSTTPYTTGEFPQSTVTLGNSAGAHTHSAGLQSFTPSMRRTVLIRADATYDMLPANAGGFSTVTPSGYSVVTANGFLGSGETNGDQASSSTVNTNSGTGGNHDHGVNHYSSGTPASYPGHDTSAVAHTHTLGSVSSITYNFNHVALRAIYKATQYVPEGGLIALWEGDTAPAGWKLCDGTDGTIDLRDYFVLVLTAGDGTVVTGTTIGLTVALNTATWSHHHQGSNRFNGSSNQYTGSGNASHSHSAVFSEVSYTPPYYALTFIQKIQL